MLADQPYFLARQVLVAHVTDTLGRTVGYAHAQGREARGQPTFRAAPPADPLPSLPGQQRLGSDGLAVGDVVLPRAAMSLDREDHRDIDRVHLLPARYADGPRQAALAQRLAERRTHPPSTALQALRIN